MKVDVQVVPEVANALQIMGLPAFRIILRGELVGQTDGADVAGLESTVDRICRQVGLDVTCSSPAVEKDTRAMSPATRSSDTLVENGAAAQVGALSLPNLVELSDQEVVELMALVRREARTRAMRQLHGSHSENGYDIRVAMYSGGEGVAVDRANFDGSTVHSVVIIGGGPAGLAAALYAARAGLRPVVVAPQGGKNAGQLLAKGVDVENYPGFQRSTGSAIVGDMRLQSEAFGVEFLNGVVINLQVAKASERSVFHLTLRVSPASNFSPPGNLPEGVSSHRRPPPAIDAHAVILATGADTRWLGVPGEEEYKGKGISSCAACDGFLFRGRKCAVIGGGDTALEEALFLSRICAPPILIIHRRKQFRAQQLLQKRVFALVESGKIEISWQTVVKEFTGEDKLQDLFIQKEDAGGMAFLSTDAAFVAIGHDPNTHLLAGKAQMLQDQSATKDASSNASPGYLATGIQAEYSTSTSVPGLFAAGDVADPTYRQAVTSAGSGAKAAMDCERWLTNYRLIQE